MRPYASVVVLITLMVGGGVVSAKDAGGQNPAAAPVLVGSAAKGAGGGGTAKVIFGFESGTQGWEIPDWALEKPDFVGKSVAVARQGATEGAQALGLVVNFPGGQWNAALAEVEEYFDWTRYQTLSVDVTLPADAPAGLKGKLILTVGESWEWTEMRRSIQLPPGQTTTLTASLASGSEDWKRTVVDDAFRKDVRKLAVRIESNKPAYQGTFSIDNVRLE